MSRSMPASQYRLGNARALAYPLLSLSFVAATGTAAYTGRYPREVFYLIAALSLLALLLYAIDKRSAIKKRWRISERSLHLVSLFGGWPGALVAQQLFRHKTRKQPFRAIFWLTAALHCGAVLWTFTAGGEGFLLKSLKEIKGYYALVVG